LVRSLRVHYWLKNALLFFPMIAGHRIMELSANPSLLGAFWSFSFIASGVYLFNDIVDAATDSRHPLKKARPIAAGELDIRLAALAAVVFVALGLLWARVYPVEFSFWLLFYLVSNVIYSLWLKRIFLLDVLFLTVFHLLRILAGASLTHIHLSGWLLSFFTLFFLWAALAKRIVEHAEDSDPRSHRTAYNWRNRRFVIRVGRVSRLAGLAISAAYIFSPEALLLYRNPLWLWVPWLSFALWNHAFWRDIMHGKVKEDPLLWVLLKPGCYITLGLCWGVIFWTGR
jgi:4-hydroxybenzoate polyprenyltransferase